MIQRFIKAPDTEIYSVQATHYMIHDTTQTVDPLTIHKEHIYGEVAHSLVLSLRQTHFLPAWYQDQDRGGVQNKIPRLTFHKVRIISAYQSKI